MGTRPRTTLLALAFTAAALLGGCGGAAESATPSVAPGPAVTPEATETPDTTAAPDTTESPDATETGEAPPTERADDVEEPADGPDGRVSVQLAGLPVGGGQSLDLDGTWCQVLFWGTGLPEGVRLEIDSVVVGEPGGTLRDLGCDSSPACVGATIDTDRNGCAVAVTPEDPGVDLVRVRLDGVLTCPDQQTCDALVPAEESWAAIEPPPGWSNGDYTGTPGDRDGRDGAGEPGSESSSPSSTPSSTPSESETGDGTGVDDPAETPGG